MTDRKLLQQMIDRIGKEPRVVKFDGETGCLVELNLADLDLEAVPEEIYACAHLRKLWLGKGRQTLTDKPA